MAGFATLPLTPSLDAQVSLSEVVPWNTTSLPELQSPDWIELANVGREEVSLRGYALSDDPNTRGWEFPDEATVPANGFHIVAATGASSTRAANRESPWLAPFKLKSSGESVHLIDPDGLTVSTLAWPSLAANEAWDGEQRLEPTPSAPNRKDALHEEDNATVPNLSGIHRELQSLSSNLPLLLVYPSEPPP